MTSQSASNLIKLKDADDQSVAISINAQPATQAATLNIGVPNWKRKIEGGLPGYISQCNCPWYMHFVFGKHDVEWTPSALYTESALPILKVPASDYWYEEITHTIELHPHLFKIVTPIKINNFESCLRSHPNQDLVKSVLHGLCYGFWPFANTEDVSAVPWGVVTQPKGMPDLDDESIQFLRHQRDTEM